MGTYFYNRFSAELQTQFPRPSFESLYINIVYSSRTDQAYNATEAWSSWRGQPNARTARDLSGTAVGREVRIP